MAFIGEALQGNKGGKPLSLTLASICFIASLFLVCLSMYWKHVDILYNNVLCFFFNRLLLKITGVLYGFFLTLVHWSIPLFLIVHLFLKGIL